MSGCAEDFEQERASRQSPDSEWALAAAAAHAAELDLPPLGDGYGARLATLVRYRCLADVARDHHVQSHKEFRRTMALAKAFARQQQDPRLWGADAYKSARHLLEDAWDQLIFGNTSAL